ncbi:MAG TPA: acetyl-CoA carboxylase biotin carboxyl carrier protein [Flavisolibacter sp.]|nr:acetyl-CoA carboxylase biotin carboxyl carrier protein [Flavisolibacter sp.]
MDFKQIQELIKLVNDSNIGEVTLEQKDFKITIKQKEEQITQIVSSMQSAPSYQLPQQPFTQQQSLPQATGGAATPEPQPAAGGSTAAGGTTVTIKSPMIGTFYRRPAPDKPDFVKPGDEVAPGNVVCIIEAMKLFNEIESEVKGKVVKILVEDASPVEYDQPLFLVEPA